MQLAALISIFLLTIGSAIFIAWFTTKTFSQLAIGVLKVTHNNNEKNGNNT